MTIVDCQCSVPNEAWEFAERLHARDALGEYLNLAEAYYAPVSELVVVYDSCDPTFQDEQMTLDISVLPGGKHGMNADLEWMMQARERFGPVLTSRITPSSHSAD